MFFIAGIRVRPFYRAAATTQKFRLPTSDDAFDCYLVAVVLSIAIVILSETDHGFIVICAVEGSAVCAVAYFDARQLDDLEILSSPGSSHLSTKELANHIRKSDLHRREKEQRMCALVLPELVNWKYKA